MAAGIFGAKRAPAFEGVAPPAKPPVYHWCPAVQACGGGDKPTTRCNSLPCCRWWVFPFNHYLMSGVDFVCLNLQNLDLSSSSSSMKVLIDYTSCPGFQSEKGIPILGDGRNWP